MRVIAFLLTIGAVAGFGFACGAFVLTWYASERAPFVEPQRAAALDPVVEISRDVPQTWPALFGVVPPPDAPAPEPEPEPVVEEAPPEENTTYFLTGLVAGAGGESWAMISENDRGVLVRVGDTLVGGETVTAIDAQGVWINYQGQRQLIAAQKPDLAGLVSTGAAGSYASVDATVAEQATPLQEISVTVESLSEEHVLAILDDAVDLSADRLFEGGMGLKVMSVKDGTFLQRLGLRPGDTIVTLDGKTVETGDITADMPETFLQDGVLDLEFLREGARQNVKVYFDQG